jgi:4-hydroxymandelate oxidase
MDPINLRDFEALARARLPQMMWDYYASGADDERCLGRNCGAYDKLALHYRVLVDVARRDLSTTVLGQRVAMPVMVAPTAFHRLAHREDVVAAASGPVWFQLYVYKDRGATEALVRRVEAAGCAALVLTVDAPLIGRRERDVRNQFALPADLGIANLLAAGYSKVPRAAGDSGLAAYVAEWLDAALDFDVIDWLRSITKLPVLVKGVVRADDAVQAIEHGAAGVIVSNHGGRQLDAAPATIDVLPRIADAVAGRAELLLDGGIRRGTDVVKALALGARAVLVGRPVLWGLAAAGREGVAAVLATLRRELDLAMALCGCPDVASVTRDLVAP